MAPKNAITPARDEDFANWYQQVVREADMAETSEVRGCMVIKPWGYALWENMQRTLDDMFKAKGVKNAYFPLLIPLRLMAKEAEHVAGFAKECAVVTHHRLEEGPDGGLVPAGKLEEPYIIRPTSETIIGETFAKWVNSYRDLPLLINQWANVMRWEMRTRLFLRTSEFLWQEGHTVHASAAEANAFSREMQEVYAKFHEEYLAVPVIRGRKTPSERFPGAVETYTIEAMMQDRKALQAGTSHDLGQNFAHAANIQFQDQMGVAQTAFTTSWGVSTRMIGGLIMTHADDDGMVMPPRVAPTHVVILPLVKNEADRATVEEYCNTLATRLQAVHYHNQPLRVEVDGRDIPAGTRKWQWVKRGVPVRIEVGTREIESGELGLNLRHTPDRHNLTADALVNTIHSLLDDMQQHLYQRALSRQHEHTHKLNSKEDFYKFFTPKNTDRPETHGGFVLAHWDGTEETEAKIKTDLAVTIRCIPDAGEAEEGSCIITGKPSKQRVLFAKAY